MRFPTLVLLQPQQLRLPLTLVLVAATLVAAGVGYAARQRFQAYYHAQTAPLVLDAREDLRSLRAALADLHSGAADEPTVRLRVAGAVADLRERLSPITGRPALRGVFLDQTDEAVHAAAWALRYDLDDLEQSLRNQAPKEDLAEVLERVVAHEGDLASMPLAWPRQDARE